MLFRLRPRIDLIGVNLIAVCLLLLFLLGGLPSNLIINMQITQPQTAALQLHQVLIQLPQGVRAHPVNLVHSLPIGEVSISVENLGVRLKPSYLNLLMILFLLTKIC